HLTVAAARGGRAGPGSRGARGSPGALCPARRARILAPSRLPPTPAWRGGGSTTGVSPRPPYGQSADILTCPSPAGRVGSTRRCEGTKAPVLSASPHHHACSPPTSSPLSHL